MSAWFYVLGIELKASRILSSFLSTELTPSLFKDKVLLILAYNFVAHVGRKLAILLPHLLTVGFEGRSHHSHLLSLSFNCCQLH